MTVSLTESFCERCGTKFSLAPAEPKPKRLGRLRTFSRGVKHYMLSDASFTEGQELAKSDDELREVHAQLDAFQARFSFCMSCRQYTCTNCWNDDAMACLTCAPRPEELHEDVLVLPGPDVPYPGPEAIAWPTAPEPVPSEPVRADAPAEVEEPVEPVPQPKADPLRTRAGSRRVARPPIDSAEFAALLSAAEAELEAEEHRAAATRDAVAETRPTVEAAAAGETASQAQSVAAEPEPEPVAAVEPEPEPEPVAVEPAQDAVAPVEPEPAPEPEPVAVEPVAAAESEPETEPVAVEPPQDAVTPVEPEPAPAPVAAVMPEPVAAEPEPQPPVIPWPEPIVTPRRPAPPVDPRPTAPPAPPAEQPVWWMVAPTEPEPPSQSPRGRGWPFMDRTASPPANGNGGPAAGRPASPPPAPSQRNVWASTSREVLNTRSDVRACGSCGLPLSAAARFCRRCGQQQTGTHA